MQNSAKPRLGIGPVRQRGQERAQPADPVGPHEQTVPPAGPALLGLKFLPADHEPRKIEFVLVRRGVGAMVVAKLAVVAFVGDLFVIAGRELGELAVLRVNPVKQRVEGGAEIKAAAAPVADLEDPRGFLFDGGPRERAGRQINAFQSLRPSSPLVNRLA